MQIYDKAKKDRRNKDLLNIMKKHKVKLNFQKSQDETWGVVLDSNNKNATILFQKCDNPAASLAHELLHIITQLNGYKKIELCTSPKLDTEDFNILMAALDNELQHHKFYNQFISYGYKDKEFYVDSDKYTEIILRPKINSYIKSNNISLIKIIPDFLTTIGKGGHISEESKKEMIELFYSINNNQYETQLKNIQLLIERWSLSDSYDSIDIHKKIILEIQPKPNFTWFGLDKNNKDMNAGYYVDEEFEITG